MKISARVNFKSLKFKLISIIGVLSLLSLATVSFVSYNNSTGILQRELEQSAINSAEHNSAIIDKWLEGITKELENQALTNSVKTLDPSKYLPVLKQISEKREYYVGLYVCDSSGNGFTTSDTTVSVSDREYFAEAMKGKTVISDPIISKSSGKLVFAVVSPIVRDGEKAPVGIVGATVALDFLQNLVQDMKISGHGYGFIINKDMNIIAHPETEWLGNNKILDSSDERMIELLKRGFSGETRYGTYKYNNVDKMLSTATIKSTGWLIAQTANVSDVMSPLSIIRNYNLITTLTALVIVFFAVYFISAYISRPIINLSQVAADIANGDLTKSTNINYKGDDEIGTFLSSFDLMVANIKSIISNINSHSERISTHSEDLASACEEVSATVEEVASTTNEVAAISAQGLENANYAANQSIHVYQVAEDGDKAVRKTIEKINSISISTKNVSEAVLKLGKQSEQIGQIINVITSIADQTNLLALNAAIEAARAGEHGKGFAVVAEEVRKLAEQSGNAAKEITGLINEIQVGVENTVRAMEKGTSEVNDGVYLATQAGDALMQIISAVDENKKTINDITEGVRQSNEGTQQFTGASEQIASAMQQVSSSAQELSSIAAELQRTVAKFKL